MMNIFTLQGLCLWNGFFRGGGQERIRFRLQVAGRVLLPHCRIDVLHSCGSIAAIAVEVQVLVAASRDLEGATGSVEVVMAIALRKRFRWQG